MIAAFASLVAEMNCDPKRQRDLGRASFDRSMDDLHILEADEGERHRFLALFAAGDDRVERRKDLIAQQRPKLRPIAARESGDDHLIGAAGAGDEMVGLETAVGKLDVDKAARKPGLRTCPRPARLWLQPEGARHCLSEAPRRRRTAIAFLRRAFVARTPAEHGVEAEQDTPATTAKSKISKNCEFGIVGKPSAVRPPPTGRDSNPPAGRVQRSQADIGAGTVW